MRVGKNPFSPDNEPAGSKVIERALGPGHILRDSGLQERACDENGQKTREILLISLPHSTPVASIGIYSLGIMVPIVSKSRCLGTESSNIPMEFTRFRIDYVTTREA